MRRVILIPLLIILILAGIYFWPVPRQEFTQVYSLAPADQVESLQAFRSNNPPASLEVDGLKWEYLSTGSGPQTIVFLHGMTGSYDIWWQQIETLKVNYRVLAVTYPAAASLAKMENGLLAILAQEGVDKFNVVGTSLGGYFAQYLVSRNPDRIEKAVLANTFPPNDLIKEKNGAIGSLIPYLPEWLVIKVLRGSFASSIYPASGNDEMTLAFLNEISAGRMRKAQVAARYACIVEKFYPPTDTAIPLLIIEASNDPLVEASLREQLKTTYPAAQVVTVDNGHFPYISTPDFYTQTLKDFFSSSN
ncbi:MAG: alpha/beta fold hydrolase [Bellilinea sp.]